VICLLFNRVSMPRSRITAVLLEFKRISTFVRGLLT
jgi:hypothetical protein